MDYQLKVDGALIGWIYVSWKSLTCMLYMFLDSCIFRKVRGLNVYMCCKLFAGIVCALCGVFSVLHCVGAFLFFFVPPVFVVIC